jgi:hexokinase
VVHDREKGVHALTDTHQLQMAASFFAAAARSFSVPRQGGAWAVALAGVAAATGYCSKSDEEKWVSSSMPSILAPPEPATCLYAQKLAECHTSHVSTPTVIDPNIQYVDPRAASVALKTLQLEFDTPKIVLEKIAARMTNEMERGLAEDGCEFKMLPSFVCDLPTGKEDGEYLALDLGGSNFRVLRFTMHDGVVALTASRKAKIPPHTMSASSSGEALFEFIAKTVASLPGTTNSTDTLPLGFTFSFPCTQYALNAGSLVHWTKGFATPGVVGENVVELLQSAFVKSNINVYVAALVNDTVGTLVAHSLEAPDTVLGVILGTGCNACYVENIENVTKWTDAPSSKNKVIINMEWGDFDSSAIPEMWTSVDAEIDANEHPGSQRFEKQISGRYLGEITRLACQRLRKENALFADTDEEIVDAVMQNPHDFLTPMMSWIQSGEADTPEANFWKQACVKTGDNDFTMELCKAMVQSESRVDAEDAARFANFWRLWSNTSDADKVVIRTVCDMVATRAARFSAAAIGAVVRKTHQENSCTVAIDGSVFEHYPYFKENMQIALLEMFGPEKNIKLELSRDGSGKGAAMIAAVYSDNVVSRQSAKEVGAPEAAGSEQQRNQQGWVRSSIGSIPVFGGPREE